MKLSQQSQAIIESAIQKLSTNIPVDANRPSSQISIFNRIRIPVNSLSMTMKMKNYPVSTIDEWTAYEGDDFYEDAERIFRTVLCRMKENRSFDKLTIPQTLLLCVGR